MVYVPILRIWDAPDWAKLAGAVAGVASAMVHDLFTGFVLIVLIPAMMSDFYFGRQAAKANDTWTGRREMAGWNAKLAAVIELLLVRGVEWWAASNGITDLLGFRVEGAIATFLAVALCGRELKSIDDHRRALGAGPLPGLTAVANLLERTFTGRLTRPEKEGEP